MTTLDPHNTQPSKLESSNRLEEYGSSPGSPSLGYPCCTYWSTLDSSWSCLVQVRMSFAVTGELDKCSASRTSSGSVNVFTGSSGRGKWLMASAFARAVVFLNTELFS